MEITGEVWNLTVSANPNTASYELPSTNGAFSLGTKTEGVAYGGTSVTAKDGFTFTASKTWTGSTSDVGNSFKHNNLSPYLIIFLYKRIR